MAMATRRPKTYDGDDHQEPPPHEEQSDAVKVHEAYLEHRLGGGEPATPEAFRRAIEQFQKLPGAIRSVPSQATPEKPGDEQRSDEEEKGKPQ
jgi:hypothetical protein